MTKENNIYKDIKVITKAQKNINKVWGCEHLIITVFESINQLKKRTKIFYLILKTLKKISLLIILLLIY